ncbi:MAG: DUF481 domain-containing protein [Phycisphaerales bacterium]|nr:DUF481 domain-containing protein [Phycisphaerales bacterium]
MAIGRVVVINVLFLLGVLSTSALGRADADQEIESALQELQAAQAAYALALEQVQITKANLELAQAHAIALGAIKQPESGPVPPPADSAPESASSEAAPHTAADPKPKSETEVPKQIKEKEDGSSFWKGWKRSVRLGLNASQGNTENSNLNVQFNTIRKSKKYRTKFESEYRLATRDGVDSQNRLELDLRHEWLAPEGSKVGWWATASYEMDEFQDWDYRITGHGGISYQFIKNDSTDLKARTGFGGSQTFGGTSDDFRPEALVTGIDLRHKISEVMNVELGSEYFVDVSEVARDRLNNELKWNIMLDKESNMNLQFKLRHRYDSEPGGRNANNDLYYDITVGWQF